MKFHIWCLGDRTVGDYGASVVIDWPALQDDANDPEVREYIQFVKDCLKKSFIEIFDDKNTHCLTDKEWEVYQNTPNEF